MSDQQTNYFSGTAKLDSAFELRLAKTKAGDKYVASASAQFNDVPGMRYGDLVIWEPETWFEEEWLERMDKGATVGFRGKLGERSYKGKDGSQKTRKEVTVYAIAPLWDGPRRG